MRISGIVRLPEICSGSVPTYWSWRGLPWNTHLWNRFRNEHGSQPAFRNSCRPLHHGVSCQNEPGSQRLKRTGYGGTCDGRRAGILHFEGLVGDTFRGRTPSETARSYRCDLKNAVKLASQIPKEVISSESVHSTDGKLIAK